MNSKDIWQNTDPRQHFNKRGKIIILMPHPNGRGWLSATGEIDVKEMYNVFTSFIEHPMIDADENWPEHWLWTLAP